RRPAPGDHVVLQRARTSVVRDGTVLQRDAATVREEQLVERAQLVRAAVDVAIAGRLAHVTVRLEGCDGRFDVAGREGTLVVADDVGLVEVGVGLEHRRAARMVAGQRPGAEVDAELDVRASSSWSA